MAAKKRILVIGLNTFGKALMRALHELGHECLGIDADRDTVQKAASEFIEVVEADATNEEALKEAGAQEFDYAVVALGSRIADSILATLALKHLGVGHVAAKARNEQHAEALRKVGADVIVFPERDTANNLAHFLLFSGLDDVRIISDGFSLARTSPLPSMIGQSVREAMLRSRFHLNIVLVQHADRTRAVPEPDYLITGTDQLFVIGWDRDLRKYSKALKAEEERAAASADED